MPFLLRKNYPGSTYPRYVFVNFGMEDHPAPQAVSYDPDRARATRFDTLEQAELWRDALALGGGIGTLAIEESD